MGGLTNDRASEDILFEVHLISLSLSLYLMRYGQLYQGGAARYTYSIRPPNYLRDCTVSEVIQVGRC